MEVALSDVGAAIKPPTIRAIFLQGDHKSRLRFRDGFFMDGYHDVKDILRVRIPDQWSGIYLLKIRTEGYLETCKIFIKRPEKDQ